jgi:hypothetical protein
VAGGADWTVLVYLDGDNNLEKDAITDFNEMERAGSNDQVKIVVQFDRVHQDGPEDDTSHGDWDTQALPSLSGDNDRRTSNRRAADLGEQNMGDPQLVDFDWGIRSSGAALRVDLGITAFMAGIAFGATARRARLPDWMWHCEQQSQAGIDKPT